MDGSEIGIVRLVKSALTGEKVNISENFDWDRVIDISRKHQIISMIYYGTLNSNIAVPEKIMRALELETLKNIYVSENQLYELAVIYKAFEDNGIDYAPIKGAELKSLYPKPEIRSMGDADILIKDEQKQKIAEIMSELGFTAGEICDNVIVWNKNKLLCVELHTALFPPHNKRYYSCFGTGWNSTELIGNHKYKLVDEDNFVFLFSHFTKHYSKAGVGIRQLADLWIFLKSKKLSGNDLINKNINRLGLSEFYNNICAVMDCWFNGGEENEKISFISEVIFKNGVFGSYDKFVINSALSSANSEISNSKTKFIAIRNLIFLPYTDMCIKYPFLKRVPLLLPFMWIYRLVEAIIYKKSKILLHKNDYSILSDNNINEYKDSLKYVGLDFNFKE